MGLTNKMEERSPTSCLRINRWLGLSAALLMMGCNGLTYTFAVYSEYAKKKLHYTQEQIDDLGAAKDFGALLGLISGIVYFLFPAWVSVCIGAILHFFGYAMVLLTFIGRMPLSFWLLCTYFAIGTGGDGWVDTACIMTSLQNFDEYKGTAVGILKSQLGLSSALFVMVYEAFFESDVSNFLILVTIVPTVVYLVLAFAIRPFSVNLQDEDIEDKKQRFQMAYGSVVILGLFLMISITLKGIFKLEGRVDIVFAAATLTLVTVICIVPLLYRPLDLLQAALCICNLLHHEVHPASGTNSSEFDKEHSIKNSLEGYEIEESIPLKANQDSWNKSIHALEVDSTSAQHEEARRWTHSTVSESLFSLDFWLITFVVSSGAGSGLAIINNFAQIGKAMKSNGVDIFVGIISIWSGYGRLIAGYGSDVMMYAGFSRPVCLLISQMAMCLCSLLLATGSVPSLFIGSAITGMAYGSYWTLTPTVISEVFGLKQVAILYKLLGIGPTILSYILSAKVLGSLYDKETVWYQQQQRLGQSKEEFTCYGRKCFGYGLIFLACVCLLGALACLWFINRTKHRYERRSSTSNHA